MLKSLFFSKTENTPQVVFDIENNLFEISGNSFPIDTLEFYSVILDWLDNYQVCTDNKDFKLNLKFDYLNTSSKKILIDIFMAFEDWIDIGFNVKVNWYYDKDDDHIKDLGEEFKELTTTPIDLVAMNS